jgi:hypothetical protein
MGTTYSIDTFYGFILTDAEVELLESDELDPDGDGIWETISCALDDEPLLDEFHAGYHDGDYSHGIGVKRLSRTVYDPFVFDIVTDVHGFITAEEALALGRVAERLGLDDPWVDWYTGLSVG